MKNWLLYYPVEKICAHFTDVLITMNREDYKLAQTKMRAGKIEYVPGVGIDPSEFAKVNIDRVAKRNELGIPENAKLFLSVGELNGNKNHETVIRAIAGMDMHYIIAGKGDLQQHLETLICELNIADRVKLLGYRKDVKELCEMADVFVFPSYREGLSVSVMEAMANGLPVICSRIRGNTDLIDENGGALFDPYSVEDCASKVKSLLISDLEALGSYNQNKVQNFSIDIVNDRMKEIYVELR